MGEWKPQSVAIIGSGAVGSYYGGRLAEAGHDVRFLMRGDYEAVRAGGLHISSPDGDFVLESPTIARRSAELGIVDWVVCALKATSIHEVPTLLPPCLKEGTRILVLMNGLGLEEQFAAWFGPERVFGGLAFTCINRQKPGYVHHIDYGPVTIGHFQGDSGKLATAAALWAGSKVRASTAPSLLAARWEKLCWNIPFGGLAVAAGGLTTDCILDDPDLRAKAESVMEEVIAVGNADLAAHAETERLNPGVVISQMVSKTETMGAYRSSILIDFLEERLMEVDAIFGEPLRRAQALGCDAPQFTLLTALLGALNKGR